MIEELLKKKFNVSYEELVNKTNFLPDNELIYGNKSDDEFLAYKNTGNELYKNKRLESAITSYTQALIKAEYKSENYGIALANRSAAFFEQKLYKECQMDIEECMRTKYPERLRRKLVERIKKCEGHLKNGESNLNDTKNDLIPTINENSNIFGGTTAIEIGYSQLDGRHIIAAKNLEAGEILFVEPAFAFAPIFISPEAIKENKCYHCLKNTSRPTPCKTCSVSVYCSSKCRNESWLENHRWECAGMKYGFWHDIGMGFPAFRVLLKAISSNFNTLKHVTETHETFGGDYKHFASLESHLADMADDNLTNISDVAAQIVRYLELKTDFFVENNFTKNEVGAHLVKYIAQLSCNACVIEHWTELMTDSDDLVTKAAPVSSGIYPSVGLMNHSCKPNIALYFLETYAIVRALTPIAKGQQIFNCYGIDYRFTEKPTRHEHLRELYHFDCNCVICADATKEFKNFDSISCHNCSETICLPIADFERRVICANCNVAIENFAILKDKLYLTRYSNVVRPTHALNLTNHCQLFIAELKKGSYLIALDYLGSYLECLKNRIGEYHIDFGIALFFKIEFLVDFLLKNNRRIFSFDIYMKMHSIIEIHLQHLQIVFEINYPYEFELLKKLFRKFESF